MATSGRSDIKQPLVKNKAAEQMFCRHARYICWLQSVYTVPDKVMISRQYAGLLCGTGYTCTMYSQYPEVGKKTPLSCESSAECTFNLEFKVATND